MLKSGCYLDFLLRQRSSDDYGEGRPLQPLLRREAFHLHSVPAGARAEAAEGEATGVTRCDQVTPGVATYTVSYLWKLFGAEGEIRTRTASVMSHDDGEFTWKSVHLMSDVG